MNLTLVIAALFTLAAFVSLFARKRRNWWVLTLLFAIAATINWLRYFEVLR